MQQIEVYIDQTGQVRFEVVGVAGMSCLDLTRSLEQALGGQIEEREMKPEAYEQEVHQSQHQHFNLGG
jgi:hypothetical protein